MASRFANPLAGVRAPGPAAAAAATGPSAPARSAAGSSATPVPGGVTAGAASTGGERAQNVKVAVRIRPFNKREKALGSASIIEASADKKSITITNPKTDKPADVQPPKTFGKPATKKYIRRS